eukprot:scaffold288_cov44-Cyclotella_meneghiniana.AAC.6
MYSGTAFHGVGGQSFNGLFFCSFGLSRVGMTARQWSQSVHPPSFVFRPGPSLRLTTLLTLQASGSLYRGGLTFQRTLTLMWLTWPLTEFGASLFDLRDAGYYFEVHVSTTSRVSSGSWRWRRTCMRRWLRLQRPKSFRSSPLPPTQLTFEQRVHRFVASFNPAFAIRPFLPSCWRPTNPTVSVHLDDHKSLWIPVLSGLRSLLACLTVIQFLARLAQYLLCCALVTPVLTWCLALRPVKRLASFCGAVMVLNVKLPTECPLVVDTGASASDMKLRDLSGVNGVRGEGIIQWPVRTSDGATVLVEVPGFHVETAGVRLLSPQVLRATPPGSGYSMTDKVSAITLPDDRVLPAPISSSNLPELLLSTDPVVVDS